VTFLALTGIRQGTVRKEIVSRPKLDTRQVLPFYRAADGTLQVGVLERDRVARPLVGAPLRGWEAIGIDFGGVDETGDILRYGAEVFSAHAGVEVDAEALVLPLPSHARSIGYLTELGLPLLLPVKPPPAATFPVSWANETHTIRFDDLDKTIDEIREGRIPAAESLWLLLWALRAGEAERRTLERDHPAPEGEAHGGTTIAGALTTRADLAAKLLAPLDPHEVSTWVRAPLTPSELSFLSFHELPAACGPDRWEVVVPGSGQALAVLPFVTAAETGKRIYFLYEEPRLAAWERSQSAPLFDLPTSTSFVNAAASFLSAAEKATIEDEGDEGAAAVARAVTERSFPGAAVSSIVSLSPALDTCPGTTAEQRRTAVVRLAAWPTLPPTGIAMTEDELLAAVADGLVHDPVVPLALLALGRDPFVVLRAGEAPARRAFVDRLTEGSVVQRRLRSYSSIEREQLGAITYARLMLTLQHRFGVRIVYPETEADRSFFKAAFRVFMASDREEQRALQGLHWSHDAYHFALGNYTLPDSFDFEAFYQGDDELPPPPDERARADYRAALKAAEDEATFFSFFTLFADQPTLTRHVAQLTFWEALTQLGLAESATARAIFDALTVRAEIPEVLRDHPLYAAREDLRSLFEYMRGFRDYHFKDIDIALGYAVKDAYRGFFLRYGLYEHDAARYIESVRAFPARLAAERPGLHPLLAALSDQKVGIALLVWDVTKALRLLRKVTRATVSDDTVRRERRRSILRAMDPFLARLDAAAETERAIRSQIQGAELTARNERLLGEINRLADSLAALHVDLWNAVESFDGVAKEVVAKERTRKLPR
jgi:hypothetical protein